MQGELASDLRKLEALHSQHQRSQHRLRDRLKWLGAAEGDLPRRKRTIPPTVVYGTATPAPSPKRARSASRLEWFKDGKLLTEKHSEQIQCILRDAVKDITRESKAKPLLGKYRGFEVSRLALVTSSWR